LVSGEGEREILEVAEAVHGVVGEADEVGSLALPKCLLRDFRGVVREGLTDAAETVCKNADLMQLRTGEIRPSLECPDKGIQV
jgi:hypothetical protein